MIEECLVVEFEVTGDDCPLTAATAATGGTVEASPPQLRHDDNVLLRCSTDDASVGEILDADDRIRYLHESLADGRRNYRCLSKQPCVLHRLTDAGFMLESATYADGVETYVGAVVGPDVLDGVLEAAGETVGVTLERVYPLGAADEATVSQRWDLTPAQEAALRAAHDAGYFAVPKGATADAVATDLGISKSAFLERLRRGQAALFDQIFT